MAQAINHIIFLCRNNQIPQEQMPEYLKDVPPKILMDMIDPINEIGRAA